MAAPFAAVQRVVAAAGPNLISNASVETADTTGQPTDWYKGGWGVNTATLSYADGGHSGAKSLYANVSAYTDGDVKWYAKPVAVTAGSSYTFSDYYKSSVATEAIVQFKSAQGAYSYISIATPVASPGNWQVTGAAFTAPVGTVEATVFHVIAHVGWLQTDDAYLGLSDDGTTPPAPAPTPTPSPVPTPVPTSGNIIANPSAETPDPANPAKPQGWQTANWGNHTAAFVYLPTGHTGNRSLQITMSNFTDGAADWAPTAQAVTPGKLYQISDYYKATADTEVDMAVTMKDGTTSYYFLGTAVASSSWAHFVGQFTMPDNAVTATMMHLIFTNGTLTTDDAAIEDYHPTGFNRAIVSINFDDGWRSTYTNGLPLLKKYSLTSTQYIITGTVTDPEYMSKSMIKAFQAAGHEIGSHTVTHPHLPQLTNTQINSELKNSQASLQSWLGVSVTDFASPYGEYNATVLSYIKKYYKSHRGVEAGYNTKDSFDPYDIKVQNIEATTTPAQVVAWVAQAQQDKTWLVLVYHGVDNSGDQYNVTPQNLDTELANIKQSGVAVETMSQALNELQPQIGK